MSEGEAEAEGTGRPLPFALFPLQIDRQAGVLAPADGDLRCFLEGSGAAISDLLVLCHGWNNDIADAEELYQRLLQQAAALLEEGLLPRLSGRRIAVLAVLWPSKRFAEPCLIPGHAAGLPEAVDGEALRRELSALAGGFDAVDAGRSLAALKALVPRLASSDRACEAFVVQARRLFQPREQEQEQEPGEGMEAFFEDPPLRVFERLSQPLGIGDGPTRHGSGIGSAAGNVLNLITYYQMKERAGRIGRAALNPLLHALSGDYPQLRLHLVGHSFGARVVSAAVAGSDSSGVLPVASLSLLQAAFSHYGFASGWDGRHHDGVFRRVLTQQAIRGPLLITHTANDWSVGVAYPLASLLAGQNASGLGDARSDYGGLGRNGARHTPEALDQQLLLAGETYDLAAGRVHNLQALYGTRNLIHNHGDVHNRHVAYAVLSAIAATQL